MKYKIFVSLLVICISSFSMFSVTLDEKMYDAVNKNKLIQVKALVSRGINKNLQDYDGNTLLMNAIEKGYLKIAEYLINNDADLNIKNNKGKNAMDIASDKKNDLIAEKIQEKLNIDSLKIKINSISKFNLTGNDNAGDFNIKYNNKNINCKYNTNAFFLDVKTTFKFMVNNNLFSGEITFEGRRMQKSEIKFDINNQNIEGKITSDYKDNRFVKKYLININAAGQKIEGEISYKIIDDKKLYTYKIDMTENKLSGFRYCEKNEIFYDIKINDNFILGKKTKKNEYLINTDINESFFYLFLIFDIYFDYLNFQKDNY